MEQPSLGLRSDCVLLFLGTQTGILLSENVYIERHTSDQQVILVYRDVGFACAVGGDPLMCGLFVKGMKDISLQLWVIFTPPGPVVWRPINTNLGLNVNLGFFFVQKHFLQ